MRGVLCLAAAISLPETLASGQPFPERNTIIFFAFAVILVTLVAQGFSLPPLIRWMGLGSEDGGHALEEREARCRMLTAAVKYLDALHHDYEDRPDDLRILDDFKEHYQRRLSALQSQSDGSVTSTTTRQVSTWRQLSQRLRAIERATAIQLRDENQINDEVLRTLERELDLLEVRRQSG
jgi:CPA1 family monovalent cation:H+ antiporter